MALSLGVLCVLLFFVLFDCGGPNIHAQGAQAVRAWERIFRRRSATSARGHMDGFWTSRVDGHTMVFDGLWEVWEVSSCRAWHWTWERLPKLVWETDQDFEPSARDALNTRCMP